MSGRLSGERLGITMLEISIAVVRAAVDWRL
jgi:hypothetical protein